jgi:2,5-furandicarboxylate decarboxylase 1
MTKDLREFLSTARSAGAQYYVEVVRELDPVLEVSAVQHKLAMKGRFPLIYCPQIKGSKLPLATGVFGSYPLLGLALGMARDEIDHGGQQAIVETYRKRMGETIATEVFRGKTAPVQEIILRGDQVDLTTLPITKHAIGDSAKYISSGMTICREPESGKPNVGIYREELKGNDRLGCRINPGSNGTVIARRYAELGKPMEIVTVIGHHPLVGMAAGYLAPIGVNEFEIAGGLLGEPIQMVPALTVDLPVPAYAEIAIEGTIDPTEQSTDGPVAEAMGFYGAVKSCFTIKVTAITMRHDAIYHDLYPAHQEHFMVSILARQIEDLDKVRSVVPSVAAVNYGPDCHPGKTIMYVSLKKESELDGRRAGEAVLRADRWVTMAIAVDDDVNVYDDREVLWAVATTVRGENNIFSYPAEEGGLGLSAVPRAVIDATRPLGKNTPRRVVPPYRMLESMDLAKLIRHPGGDVSC